MANLPIADFLNARLTEYDPDFELRKGTGFEKLFFQPLQFIVQPLRDEADEMQTAQSFRQILLTDDPDAFDEESVDSLASNLFVDRREGNLSSGVARAYFNDPLSREFAANAAIFVGNNGLNYSNPEPFSITEGQMSAQIDQGLYYFDIPVTSEETGEETELDEGGLVELLNDPDVQSVTNPNPIVGGLARETNTELIDRAKNSIAVRDLVTGKGFNAILFETFPGSLKELQPVGFGDQEMMRDIVFNTHIGGKVDGHFCAPRILEGFTNFVGVLIDSTRQAPATSNVQLNGTAYSSLGNAGIDRTGGLDPVVQEVKASFAATYTSPVDMSAPLALVADSRIKMTIDGETKEFRVAGVTPAATTRNEIVALINAAFGIEVAFPTAVSLRVNSPTKGKASEIVITDPDIGTTALLDVFGLATPGTHLFEGDGPITFLEGTHYEIDDVDGRIRRVLGSTIVPDPGPSNPTTGETSLTNIFNDATAGIFSAVTENDILTIVTGADAGDYRILEVLDDNNLVIDAVPTAAASGLEYTIRRTGIKDGEVVFVSYYFNPLSIDIGNQVKLDPEGKTRGFRPGREALTITDLAMLRITSIEIIDPITLEGTGEFLDGGGGYGAGGYGQGPYGIGSTADYYLVVNEPHERFSAFEDSYLVLGSGFAGLSFRVSYDYVPEVTDLHNFVRSESERVLDGDILMRHMFPAFVTGNIEYGVDETDTSIPDNETLQELVREFISSVKVSQPLQFSDIKQFITRNTDPFDRYGSFVRNFTLTARMPNTDGSVTVFSGDEQLILPTLDPFPKDTDRPQSARISHWFARKDLTLTRISAEETT